MQCEDFKTQVAIRHGWPTTVSPTENIDLIHDLILADQRISTKGITKTLEISR